MTYDKDRKAIVVGPGSDFIADSGVHFVLTLKKLSAEMNAPAFLLNDWRIIEKWLGCAGRDTSPADEEKIGKAWRAYYAIGLAPSIGLQPVFDKISEQYRLSGCSYRTDKAPIEVMEVFDRILATKEEITAKRAYDIDVEKIKLQKVFGGSGRKRSIKEKINSLSRSSKTFVIIFLIWGTWVIFRTSDSYELFGIYFVRWDSDMFLANLLLPPLVMWVAFVAYRWISSDSK